ncbi:protein turtle homolog A-like [Xyrauchen texanus]|uniref:protein turtle homolog A-like n=1 Tax=Xyrauchen texanus TaxID=154827 RepID=UPI0022429806|nr:protein turtle homolog A-like [Xyrauchen texanus]XP_051972039.1 protein turtle homolog A-like [Xyrauchen texanus]
MPIMTLKILPRLEVIVAALCLFNLTNADEAVVHAKKGDNAVLTCSLPTPDQGSSAPQHVIEWVRQDYDIAILIQFGVHDPRVHPNFDGRVSLIEGTSLQVRGLLLEDEGLYECRILPLDKTTDETESSGSWTLLSITAPPMFTETPPPVIEVFVGRSLTLRCAARGNPRPTITWTKDGGPIKPQKILKFMNGSLSFHAVSRETSGQYQCHAFNKEGNVTHITKLKVIGPPVIIIPPTDTFRNMSQDAKLKCQAEADPPNMTYVWQRQGEDIYHIESLKSRVKVIVDGTLLISRLTPGDSGNYTCTPSNGLPLSPSASAVLTVQHPAQVIRMPKLTFLPTGMKGIISCPVTAEPPLSHVDWTKDGNPLDLGMYPGWTLTLEGSIVIATANDDAAGVYTCTPYNSFGTMGQSEPTNVILQDPPSLKMSPRKEYRQEVGRMLVIPCQMNGDPAPKIIWKKVGTASRSLFTLAGNGSLILHPLSKDHQGEWECSSSNQVATVSARTTVLVLSTSPHAVSSVSVIPGINQANVSWVAGFDGGYTQKFTVWYKQSAEKTEEKQEWLSFPIMSTENSLLVTNLLPATEYQFSIMAQNKVGTGPFSEIVIITTLDALPVVTKLEPPTGLSVNQSSEGILLRWSVPQSKSPPIDGFVVQSRLEGREWVNLKEHISPNESQFFHLGLCKDCKYELRLLSWRGDELSIPSPSISVSTIGMAIPPASPRLLDFPDQLMAGVMGGVILLCLTLILALAIVCFIFHRRGQRCRQNMKDLPPAINKNPPVKADLSSPDNTLKQQLLPDRPHSYTSSSSDHSSLDKSNRSDFQGQRQHLLPQANPPYHHSLTESHLQRASLAPMNLVEFIDRGPDGRFNVQPCKDVNVARSNIKRNLSQNSHWSSDGNRSFSIHKSQSLRSYRNERKPPFVLSVDLPPFGSDIPSSSRTHFMAKHLSLNGHYLPIREQEFFDGQDQTSICSDSSDSFLYPHSESTLGCQSLKQGNSHPAANTLVLQMEHEREQGNLNRCLTLAREREELERQLCKYTVEPNSSINRKIADKYGEMLPSGETQSNYQAMRQSLLFENSTVLKGRAASCIPWEARHRISSASLVPLHTSYGKDNQYRMNPHGCHTIQKSNFQRSRSLERGECQKSHTWDQRRSRTPVDSNLSRMIDVPSIYKMEKTQVGVGHIQKNICKSQQHFDPHIHSSSDNQQGWKIAKSTRQMNQPGDSSEMSVDGPELESQCSPYSRSIMDLDHSYETLEYDRPRLSELEQDRSIGQKLESGNAVSRKNQERFDSWSSRNGSPKDVSGTMLRKTKSLGSNTWNRHKSTHSLDSKKYKEQFLPPDAWIDSLTLGRDPTVSPFAGRPNTVAEKTKSSPNMQADSLNPSESQLQNHECWASKPPGGFTNDSEFRNNLVSGHHTHALSPGDSSWPMSYTPSRSVLPSGSRSQSQDGERDEEDEYGQEVDVEINQYRKSSETEGSYRSYASQSSGRGSMDAPNSRQFSFSPPLTISPETTEESDRDDTGLPKHERQERPRTASVDESYEWDSAYVPMHSVHPKASISKSGLHGELLNQEKQSSTTKLDYRPDLDLKPKGLFPPAGLKISVPLCVAPTSLSPRCEQESLLAIEIQKSSIVFPNPEDDTVLF